MLVWSFLVCNSEILVQRIESTDFPDHLVDIGRSDPDAVADKDRRRGKTWHEFDVDLSGPVIEEHIVAVTELAEVPQQIAGTQLDKISYGVDRSGGIEVRWNDIELPEADTGLPRNGEINAVAPIDAGTAELLLIEKLCLVECGAADELHVWVADCAA